MIARLLPLVAALTIALAGAYAKPAASEKPVAPTASVDNEKGGAYAAFIAEKTTQGPAKIAVRDQAEIDLPQGFAFLPEKPARDFMKTLGNRTGEDFVGLVLPVADEGWFVIVEYEASGYVKDDDAKTWNADDLLKDIRTGTEKQNLERRVQKVPELDVVGWVEAPHYDAKTHRLVWSIAAREKGAAASDDLNINYRTLMLGRQGYVAMDLITSQKYVAADKPKVHRLLAALSFKPAKGYGDFNASTDKIAEYGLAALIGGIAIKKLGLFALLGAFFIKAAKFLVVFGIGMLAWARRFFRKKDGAPTEPAPSLLDAPQPPQEESKPSQPEAKGPFAEG